MSGLHVSGGDKKKIIKWFGLETSIRIYDKLLEIVVISIRKWIVDLFSLIFWLVWMKFVQLCWHALGTYRKKVSIFSIFHDFYRDWTRSRGMLWENLLMLMMNFRFLRKFYKSFDISKSLGDSIIIFFYVRMSFKNGKFCIFVLCLLISFKTFYFSGVIITSFPRKFSIINHD